MGRWVAVGAAVVFGWLAAAPAQAAPAVWRVSDADSEIYLFGTLHALSAKAQWRTPLYDRALAEAGTVWFEADMAAADPETVRGLIMKHGFDPATPLSRKLSAKDLAALRRHVDVDRIEHLRPWVAALMVSMQPALSKGASVERGADMSATRSARAGAKTVRAFETFEDQVRLFSGLPAPSELRYLTDVLHELDGSPRTPGWRVAPTLGPRALERAWLAGDLASLGPGLVGEMKSANPELYDALLRRRNLAWADRLADAMDGSGVELVNVGALHLVGGDGLPALLAARGFRVERVQ